MWYQMVHIGMLIYSYYVDIIVCCLKSDGKLEVNIMFCIWASRRTSRVWWSASSRSNCGETQNLFLPSTTAECRCANVYMGVIWVCVKGCVYAGKDSVCTNLHQGESSWAGEPFPVNNVGRGDPRLPRSCSWCSTVTGWMKTYDYSLSKE